MREIIVEIGLSLDARETMELLTELLSPYFNIDDLAYDDYKLKAVFVHLHFSTHDAGNFVYVCMYMYVYVCMYVYVSMCVYVHICCTCMCMWLHSLWLPSLLNSPPRDTAWKAFEMLQESSNRGIEVYPKWVRTSWYDKVATKAKEMQSDREWAYSKGMQYDTDDIDADDIDDIDDTDDTDDADVTDDSDMDTHTEA